jgi:signal transduction histidine kinase
MGFWVFDTTGRVLEAAGPRGASPKLLAAAADAAARFLVDGAAARADNAPALDAAAGSGVRCWVRLEAHALPPVAGGARVAVAAIAMTELVALREEVESLRAQLATARETERRAVAEELHDGLQQTLAAAKLTVDSATIEHEAGNIGLSGQDLTAVASIIDGAIDDCKRVVAAMHPRVLEELGLIEAVRFHLARLPERNRPRITFDVTGDARDLTPAAEVALFRIVQEAVGNALKYSSARHISVRYQAAPEATTLRVADDGCGFVRREARGDDPGRHFGLASIEQRAQAAGGSATVCSAPGGGTAVTVTLPGSTGRWTGLRRVDCTQES